MPVKVMYLRITKTQNIIPYPSPTLVQFLQYSTDFEQDSGVVVIDKRKPGFFSLLAACLMNGKASVRNNFDMCCFIFSHLID